MANIAEDENPKVIYKTHPRGGEKWLHPESGHVVKVMGLHIIFKGYNKGCQVHIEGADFLVMAKSDIPANSQCVIFKGSQDWLYIRTVENFLERFKRIG